MHGLGVILLSDKMIHNNFLVLVYKLWANMSQNVGYWYVQISQLGFVVYFRPPISLWKVSEGGQLVE
jgi:hypothetical protein